MSTETKVLSQLDTWVLVEAKRVLADLLDVDDREQTQDALDAVSALAADYGSSHEPPIGFDAMLARFREHKEARDAHEEAAKHHAQEAAKLEALLVEAFALEGTESIRRNGKTFYLAKERTVSALADRRADLVEVMRALEHDEMIVVQPQRFSSWAKEMLDDAGLPAEVAPLVKIHEAMRLRMRSS